MLIVKRCIKCLVILLGVLQWSRLCQQDFIWIQWIRVDTWLTENNLVHQELEYKLFNSYSVYLLTIGYSRKGGKDLTWTRGSWPAWRQGKQCGTDMTWHDPQGRKSIDTDSQMKVQKIILKYIITFHAAFARGLTKRFLKR